MVLVHALDYVMLLNLSARYKFRSKVVPETLRCMHFTCTFHTPICMCMGVCSTLLHKTFKTLPLESVLSLWGVGRSAVVAVMAFGPPWGFPHTKKTWTGLWLLSLSRHIKVWLFWILVPLLRIGASGWHLLWSQMAIFVSFSIAEISLMMLPKYHVSSQEHLRFSHGAFPCGLWDLRGCGAPYCGISWSQA